MRRARTTRCPARQTTGSRFAAADGDASGVFRLLCPTCDEPLIPEYRRRCELCGHEFADGYNGDALDDEGPSNPRTKTVLLAFWGC